MNKFIRNIIYSFVLSISFFFLLTNVKANTIKKINMDIYIDQNGNANVTEVWEANLTSGTEGYRPYTKLGNSSISNFKVTDDSGVEYTSISSWNTKATFEEKTYKSGIHKISNGVELCFGISNYGNRTYTLKYTISNLVTQYTDTQGIYFNFINFNQSIGYIKIVIHSDIPFSLDNSRIWGFGNNGTSIFDNGSIVIESKDGLTKSQYVSELIRFESNLFNTSNESSKSFDDIYDEATSTINETTKSKNSPTPVIFIYLIVLFSITIYIILPFFLIFRNKSKHYSGETIFAGGKDMPKDLNMFRDIPCNKDLFYAYWLVNNYDLGVKKPKEGIIGAILLKWVKENRIKVTETKKELFSFKDNNYAVDLSSVAKPDDALESDLYEILLTAAGANSILEAKEFEKWCKGNYFKLNNWYNRVESTYRDKLEKEELIVDYTIEEKGLFGTKRTINCYQVLENVRDDAIKLAGLKKFLEDSSIEEKRYIEVHLWDEYLMFAELLGIADKVRQEFSKLYPNFNEASLLNANYDYTSITRIAAVAYSGYSAGLARASSSNDYSGSSRDYSGSSRDSGGGGSNYSSGGSSSGGSSGGGFR